MDKSVPIFIDECDRGRGAFRSTTSIPQHEDPSRSPTFRLARDRNRFAPLRVKTLARLAENRNPSITTKTITGNQEVQGQCYPLAPEVRVEGPPPTNVLHRHHREQSSSSIELCVKQTDDVLDDAPDALRDRQQYVRKTSLHGRIIPTRTSRNEAKYRKMQAKVYNFLERPKTWPAIAYHMVIFICVFGCLILSVLSSIQTYEQLTETILRYVELCILFGFFTEYFIRLWSAGCRSRYQTWRGRLQFARRPFCLIDLTVIIASIVVLAVDSDRRFVAANALRGLRFFQILRMIRMDRRGGSFKLLASVVWAHRQELFTTMYIGFLVLILSSFLIYLVEKKAPQTNIKTYADALWWGVVTLCTVGYGDAVPKTPMGKFIAAFCSLAGISFFALPAGILGSGFALKVQQHQRQKHLVRRRVPAASLIQCVWRCYASDPESTSVATWKIYLQPVKKTISALSTSTIVEKSGFPRLTRFSTLKRRPEKMSKFPLSRSSMSMSTFASGAVDTPSPGDPSELGSTNELTSHLQV